MKFVDDKKPGAITGTNRNRDAIIKPQTADFEDFGKRIL